MWQHWEDTDVRMSKYFKAVVKDMLSEVKWTLLELMER